MKRLTDWVQQWLELWDTDNFVGSIFKVELYSVRFVCGALIRGIGSNSHSLTKNITGSKKFILLVIFLKWSNTGIYLRSPSKK